MAEAVTQLRFVVGNAPIVLFALDLKGVFTLSEGRGLEALGLAPGQVVGQSVFELFRDAPWILEQSRRALGGEEFLGEGEVAGRWFETHYRPIRDERGEPHGAIGVATDVTARKHAEAERATLHVQLRSALDEAKLAVAARDEFLSIASHELNTPLASLRMALQTLQRMFAQPEGGTEELRNRLTETALRQGARLSDLVASLLDVTRIDGGRTRFEPEALELCELVREVSERFAFDLNRAGSALELCLPVPVPGVWDRSHLDQVLTNLLANAVKFGDGRPIELAVRGEDHRAFIVVRDQGIGIAASRLPFIFDRFERAVSSAHYGGLGLGLFIARRLVLEHGGRISVESIVGQGATFTVELPRTAKEAGRGA